MLIINADDFGGNRRATDNALSCFRNGHISSVSAMVFMSDSGRAAELASGSGLDVGLHLNFSEPLDAGGLPENLVNDQALIRKFLWPGKYKQLLYNPFLRRQFDHVYRAQLDEFEKLYHKAPSHINGHHHMHLCMNMVLDRIMARGVRIRRNFTFFRGEKDVVNRMYRRIMDGSLKKRYVCTDYFFNIQPLHEKGRLERIFDLARLSTVEMEVHPEKDEEMGYLMSGAFAELLRDVPVGTYSML